MTALSFGELCLAIPETIAFGVEVAQHRPMVKSGWLITVLLCVVYVFYTMTVLPAF